MTSSHFETSYIIGISSHTLSTSNADLIIHPSLHIYPRSSSIVNFVKLHSRKTYFLCEVSAQITEDRELAQVQQQLRKLRQQVIFTTYLTLANSDYWYIDYDRSSLAWGRVEIQSSSCIPLNELEALVTITTSRSLWAMKMITLRCKLLTLLAGLNPPTLIPPSLLSPLAIHANHTGFSGILPENSSCYIPAYWNFKKLYRNF